MGLDEKEIVRDLSKMIRGELTSGEVKRLVRREGFDSFSEMCGTRLPEDLGRVRIGTRDILTRIDRFRRRAIDLYELWFWADELYNISFNHRIAYEPRSEELIGAALSAISVVANDRLFPNTGKAERGLDLIRSSLMRRRKLKLRNIFMRIFEDLEVAHFANKSAPASEERAGRFADVVLLDRAWREGADVIADYSWMIAFTVTARSLYEEERAADAALEAGLEGGGGAGDWVCPDCRRERQERERGAPDAPEGEPFRFEVPGWREPEDEDDAGAAAEGSPGCDAARPGVDARIRPTPPDDGEEIDRAPALRRLVPNFAFETYKPRYLYDGDGIAEIVLETGAIGPREVEYATRLFCIANRIRTAHIDGRAVKTLVVRPGTGRRARA